MAGTSRKKETTEEVKKTGRAGSKERAGKAEGKGSGESEKRERGTSRRQKETTASSGKANSSGKGNGSEKKGSSGKSKNSGKENSSRQSGSGRRMAEEAAAEQESFMKTEVAIIVTFAVSVLLFLSNFGLCGTVGDICRGVMLGVFGSVGYLAPVLLFVGTCFYMSNRGNLRAVMKMAAVAIVLLALCGLDQMLLGGGMHEDWKIGQYYSEAAASGSGGGFVGGILAAALCSALGSVGAYIVLLVGFAIGAVCITEKSLVNFVKRGSGRAYEYAKEDMSRRRELHEERKEEKRRFREEQRVRGVNLGATDLSDSPPLMREFAAGIPAGTVLSGDEPGDELPVPETQWGTDVEPEVDAAPEPGEKVNPADVFRGKIQMPYSVSEPVSDSASETVAAPEPVSALKSFPASEPVSVSASAPEPVSGLQASFGDGLEEKTADRVSVHDLPEEDDGDRLLKRIYVRRDTRTVAELSGGAMGSAAKTGLGYQAVSAGAASDFAEPKRPAEPVFSAEEEAEAEIPWPEEEEPFIDRISREPVSFERDLEEPVSFETDLEEPVSFERDLKESVSFEREPVYDDLEEEWKHADSGMAEDDWIHTEDSAPEEEESGINYDGFYIPEEPKTVVTTSGKVIETDTEAVRKTIEKKREARKALPEDELTVNEQIERKQEEEQAVKKEYVFPPLSLLKKGEGNRNGFSEEEYKETAIKLQQTLQNFGVGVTVTYISCGPTVTRYELHPEQGVKVSKIVSLADDIKLNLAAADIRIEAPIPGKAAVGIEVPNKENSAVLLRDLLESDSFKRHDSRMAFAVGKDIGGQVVVSDIAKMPHLLIAGATGSGKSVCINTLIMSVIYKAKPDEVKLIMIDPKVVELSVYNGIPHLLIPVVTDPKKASGALNWAVAEMMDRYAKFAKYGVRDLKGFNAKVDAIKDIEDPKKPEKLPQIIIIVDELADLMMVAPGEVEDAICRLAQLARAAGIHLVIATQRPSVNVITGVIKANIPSRIAFSVSSGVDSRTIIDMVGAEKLLGKGDMLFYPSGYQKPQRVQGAFVSDQEVSAVVEFLTEQGMTAQYNSEIEAKIGTPQLGDGGSAASDRDTYFVQAGRFIIEKDKASIGMLQRMFKIGFNRAARIMDQLAEAGVVGEEEGTKPRKVLMSMEQFENMLEE